MSEEQLRTVQILQFDELPAVLAMKYEPSEVNKIWMDPRDGSIHVVSDIGGS